MRRQHKVLRQEQIGRWLLTLGVSPTGRFIVHLRFPGERSWTRSKFFSSHAQAETEFFRWRDGAIVRLAVEALGIKL